MTKKERVLMMKVFSMLQILTEETDKFYLKDAAKELTEELREILEN